MNPKIQKTIAVLKVLRQNIKAIGIALLVIGILLFMLKAGGPVATYMILLGALGYGFGCFVKKERK